MASQQEINDQIQAALKKEGYAGALNDQISAWLIFEGATSLSINNQWHDYFNLQLIPAGAMSDRMFTWLGSLGYLSGHLNDRMLNYWTDRAAAP